MLVSTLDYSTYVGRIAIGRIERGRCGWATRCPMLHLGDVGMVGGRGRGGPRVMKLFTFLGLERIEVEEAGAGDIVALAGLEGVEIGKTITDPNHRGAHPGDRRGGAHALGGLHGEQLAIRRAGGQVRHHPAGAGASLQGAGAQRRAAGGGHRPARHLHRERAGRAAPLHPHGDHAPRGVRVPGVAPPGHHPHGATDGKVLEPYEEAVVEVPSEPGGHRHREDGLRARPR